MIRESAPVRSRESLAERHSRLLVCLSPAADRQKAAGERLAHPETPSARGGDITEEIPLHKNRKEFPS